MNPPPAILASPALAFTEPTAQDLALAEVLGYKRPADIRTLIKRHMKTLEAFGLVRQVAVPIVSGKGRVTMATEYHLTKAQAAFIIAKAGTKRANSLTVALAEVFAMVLDTKLVPANEAALCELEDITARELERRRVILEEERAARSEAFALLGRGRSRARRRRWRKGEQDGQEPAGVPVPPDFSSSRLCSCPTARKRYLMTDTLLPAANSSGIDERESSSDYVWTLARLDALWRVVESRDGLQWIVQKKRRNGDETRWYSPYHFRSKASLLRHVRELEERKKLTVSPSARAVLTGLPPSIETTRTLL